MKKRTTVFLPESYIEKLAAFCNASGLSSSEVIRRAIDDYLEQKAPKVIATAHSLKKGQKK